MIVILEINKVPYTANARFRANCKATAKNKLLRLMERELELPKKIGHCDESEQIELKATITNLTEQLERSVEQTKNIDRFMEIVRKYTDIQALDSVILRELIEKIVQKDND